jgi:pentatricopeptide repeat protein
LKQFQKQYEDLVKNPSSFFAKSLLTSLLQNSHFDFAVITYDTYSTIHKPTVVIYNTILNGCKKFGKVDKAKQILLDMKKHHVHPDALTLKTVSIMCFETKSTSLALALIDLMRSMITDTSIVQNITCTQLVRTFSEAKQSGNALFVLNTMDYLNVEMDEVTCITLIQACMNSQDVKNGTHLYERLYKLHYPLSPRVRNSLIFMFGSFGKLDIAQQLFDESSQDDVISWNALLSNYNKKNPLKTLELFHRMLQSKHVKPDKITFCIALTACANLNNLDEGMTILSLVRHRIFINIHSKQTLG